MKRVFFLCLMVVCLGISWTDISYAQCNNQWSKGAVPCGELWNYLSQSQLNTGEKEWSAYKGYFFVVNSSTLRTSIRFDSQAIGIIRSNGGFALELDVVDNNHILGGESWSYAHNFPSGVVIRKDVGFMDPATQLSLLILHPQLLQEEREYIVEFYLDKPITNTGEIHLNVSLSVDYPNPLYQKDDWTSGWNYFTVEIDPFATFQYAPNSTAGVCWVSHETSGFQFCSGMNAPYCPTSPVINTCTGPGADLPESGSTTPPVSGSNGSTDLPNLTMREVYLLDANKNRVSSIHVNKNFYCHMNVKNYGEKKANGVFENRCWVSKGNKFDGFGGSNDAEDIGKEDMDDLDNGYSRSSDEDSTGIEWPGTYNLVGCTDASKKVTESNEKDNCNVGDHAVIQEFVFQVVSDPNLKTTAISLTGGTTNPNINQPFGISSTTANPGENFGPEYVYIGYFIDGALVGQNQILRANMKGGMSKTEETFVSGGIATAGIHEVKACADYNNGIAEINETDNCTVLLVTVNDPNAPPPNPDPDPTPSPTPSPTDTDDDDVILNIIFD